jgi:cytochrome b6-f complex iron-sulfur subunit
MAEDKKENGKEGKGKPQTAEDEQARDQSRAPRPLDPAELRRFGCDPESTTFSRRDFLTRAGWAALGVASAATAGGLLVFGFPRVLDEPPHSFKVGPAKLYKAGTVNTRWVHANGFWIVRDTEKLVALKAVCTHLGCVPQWRASENRFLCPCHGSSFHGPGESCGINYEGPAPRPLERLRIFLDPEGQVVVDTSRTFRWEKGQWEDPECRVMI